MNTHDNAPVFLKAIFDGYYTATSDGIIKSHDKNIIGKITTAGYRSVGYTTGGKRYMIGFHRLLWLILVGPIKHGLAINHKNGIKTDNRICNLEVVTYSENQKHALRNGLYQNVMGESHGMAKLTESQVLGIRSRYKAGETQANLSKIYNVHVSNIKKICKRLIWRHI